MCGQHVNLINILILQLQWPQPQCVHINHNLVAGFRTTLSFFYFNILSSYRGRLASMQMRKNAPRDHKTHTSSLQAICRMVCVCVMFFFAAAAASLLMSWL